jgi:hypothetical protein
VPATQTASSVRSTQSAVPPIFESSAGLQRRERNLNTLHAGFQSIRGLGGDVTTRRKQEEQGGQSDISNELCSLYLLSTSQFAYQSECGDHRLQERHCVSVHWCRHAGHTPPVSNVFHSYPQVQSHLSSLWGDQPHNGQRMRGGSDSPGFLSSSSSRSGTMTGLSAMGVMPSYYDLIRTALVEGRGEYGQEIAIRGMRYVLGG